MAAGAAGHPGVHALKVKDQGVAAATTQPPATGATAVLGRRRSRSPVRNPASSTYSENLLVFIINRI